MTDETNKQEETSTQQALSALEAPAPEVVPEQTQQQVQEGVNFRRLREENSRLERERNEWMKMAQMQQPPQVQQPVEQTLDLNPDDLVEWKVVSREINKIKQELNQYKEQSQVSLVETQLRSKYPDLDSVLSKDNLDALRDREPEIYNTIYSSQDMYSKAASAYKLIKQMGIGTGNNEYVSADKERVVKNMAKPKAAATVTPNFGSTALGEAASYNGKITPEQKKKNYEEMLASSKKHFFG